MADNPTVDNGSLTDYTVAADDDGTALHQYVKLEFGADNTQTKVSAANPLPVTGTVDLGATDNAVLDAIAASVAAIDIDATTIIGHVDGIEALIGTTNTSLTTIAGAVAGTEMQVDIVAGGPTQYTEDDAAAANPVGTANILVRADTPATLVTTDGDNVAQRGTNYGAAYVQLLDGANKASIDTAGADNESNTSSRLNVRGHVSWFDGTTWDRAKGDATDGLLVNLGANNDVTLAAGTNTNEVVGDAAHDAAIAGNPVRLAGRALTADYTAVATGDTADLITSVLGKQVMLPYALPGAAWKYAAASGGIVNTTAITIKAAGAAGVVNYLTHLSVINGHATVSTEVAIRDGAAGTVIWRGFAQAAGGGVAETFVPPLASTAATLLEVVCITTGSAVYVNAQGYAGAE